MSTTGGGIYACGSGHRVGRAGSPGDGRAARSGARSRRGAGTGPGRVCPPRRAMKLLSAALAAVLLATVPATGASAHGRDHDLRIATYNLSLNRPTEGMLREHLADPGVDDVYRRQARNV